MWHVKRSWLKHLLIKVTDAHNRVQLQLYLEMSSLIMGRGLDTRVIEDPAVIAAGTAGDLLLQQVRQQIQAFVAKCQPYEPRFVEYFKTQGSGRVGGYGACGLWVDRGSLRGRLWARSVESRRGWLHCTHKPTHTHTSVRLCLWLAFPYHTHAGDLWLSVPELQMALHCEWVNLLRKRTAMPQHSPCLF